MGGGVRACPCRGGLSRRGGWGEQAGEPAGAGGAMRMGFCDRARLGEGGNWSGRGGGGERQGAGAQVFQEVLDGGEDDGDAAVEQGEKGGQRPAARGQSVDTVPHPPKGWGAAPRREGGWGRHVAILPTTCRSCQDIFGKFPKKVLLLRRPGFWRGGLAGCNACRARPEMT